MATRAAGQEVLERNLTQCCANNGVPKQCNFCSFFDRKPAVSTYSLDCVSNYLKTFLWCATGKRLIVICGRLV